MLCISIEDKAQFVDQRTSASCIIHCGVIIRVKKAKNGIYTTCFELHEKFYNMTISKLQRSTIWTE